MDQTTAFRHAFGRARVDPAQRAAALAALRDRPDLHEIWLAGLPYNTSAPGSVLCRLLNVPGRTSWLELDGVPAEVLTAAARHPDRRVRSAAAENAHFPAECLPALSQGTAAERATVRDVLTVGNPLPDRTIADLMRIGDTDLRRHVTRQRVLPEDLRTSALADEDVEVRAAVLPFAWADLTPDQRAVWEAERHPSIVEAVADGKRRAPVTTLEQFRAVRDIMRQGDAARGAALDRAWAEALVADERTWVRRDVAANPSLPLDQVHRLATDPDASVRAAVADRTDLPAGLVERLAHDPANEVRLAVSVRPDLTEDQRQAIEYAIPAGYQPIYGWVADLHDEPSAMRRLAASAHPLIRRAVAAAKRLPPDVVAALERDDDLFVRLTLAQCCDDATADFMVDVYEQWDGKWSFVLPSRPTFPRAGLARLADHPDRRMRDLAIRDPLLTAETVERLGHYEDPRVPVDHAIDHLDTLAAVRHPALPPSAMHLMLDLAGVPPE